MRSRTGVAAALATLLFAIALQAQESRGTILGRVTDASGAVVPTADVKAVSVATGVTVTAQTNESGNYSLPFLVAGFYTVSAEANGFKKFVRENVQVRVNDRVEVNMEMVLGSVSEQVEVTATTPLLATADASLGQVVDERRVLELLPTQLTAEQIATRLFVSTNTVKSHLRHLYAKLGVTNRTAAVERARELCLLASPGD